jgi:hypothetical protein
MESKRALNLISHRSPQSIWDKRGWQGETIEERLGPWLASVAGASLLAYGATRRSWRGVGLMMGGVALMGCAAAGLCNPRYAAGRLRHLRQAPMDRVTMESMHSFPASDAPSSNAVAGHDQRA